MKATGIVRRIDDLGRIVIPKEIRKKLRIKEGESIEVYLDDLGQIVLKKFSEFSDLEKTYQLVCDMLYDMYENTVLITTLSEVSFVSSKDKENYLKKEVNEELLSTIGKRKEVHKKMQVFDIETQDVSIYPLLNNGDLLGALIMIYDTTPKEQVNMELLKYNEQLLLKHFG